MIYTKILNPKRLTFLFITFFVLIFSHTSTINAVYNPLPPGGASEDYRKALEARDTNLPQWSLQNMKYIMFTLTKFLVGYPALSNEPVAIQGGVVTVIANNIDQMYLNKPASTGQYFAYLKNKIQIVQPAYAQGQGWQFLSPILPLWVATRNATYALFVVIFVAVGFMIMFRQKIDSQIVATIQAMIPKLIVALLLVTFSYAICGLLVDLTYLFNALIKAIFDTPFRAIGGRTWEDTFYPITYLMGLTGSTGLLTIITKGIGAIMGVGGAAMSDYSGVFALVVAFVFVSSVIKIFFALLGRYVTIIISTIFSPLAFAWASLPGQNDTSSKFFKSFLSSILSFPAILFLINLAAAIIQGGKSGLTFELLAPFAGVRLEATTPGGIGASGASAATILTDLIGLGIIMSASKITETIDDILSVKSSAPGVGSEVAGGLRRIPIIGGLLG